MPRIFTNEVTYPYSWAQTVLGILHKYPNPHADHVVSVDTIDQSFDEASGKLRLERVLGVRQSAPRWVVRLLSLAEDTYVREVMVIDPVASKVGMTTTNMTLSEYLLAKEYITYTPAPPSTSSPASVETDAAPISQSSSTIFKQRAKITCEMTNKSSSAIMTKAGRKLEDSSFDRYASNAVKGKEGLMTVLSNLWGEPARGQQ